MLLNKKKVYMFLSISLLGAGCPMMLAAAEDDGAATQAGSKTDPDAPALADLVALLRDQQKELAATRKLVESQQVAIVQLRNELDALRGGDAALKSSDAQTPDQQEAEVPPSPIPATQVDPQSAPDEPVVAAAVVASGEEETIADERSKDRVDDPTQAVMDEFPGSWRLPGTNGTLRIGGFVRASMAYNVDPLAINDRFIVGSIPPDGSDTAGVEAETTVSANQSRLNFDLREPSQFGLLRAFVEGDFRGDGDTFRLRHAFGQWGRMLAGKTWSGFVDTQASPEEVDFEGLNGRVNVRQALVRLTPSIGRKYEFQLSLEDPNPSVTNGNGVSRTPDVIGSARMQWTQNIHAKMALLLRQVRATANTGDFGQESEFGFGVTLSGRAEFPRFGARDAVFFQVNGGRGIGRYINDLNSVGEFDGVINPVDGELELIDVFAGYLSYQHWWREEARSNITFGWVYLNNPGFVDGSFYQQTRRASANFLWSPMHRVDLGAEFLWGERENEDGSSGTATQLQFVGKYYF